MHTDPITTFWLAAADHRSRLADAAHRARADRPRHVYRDRCTGTLTRFPTFH